MKVVGANQARGAILRYLAQSSDQGCTSGQIARELDLGTMTVFRHLSDLEELGVVHTDSDSEGARKGVRLIYRLNKERLNHELAALQRYLNGQ